MGIITPAYRRTHNDRNDWEQVLLIFELALLKQPYVIAKEGFSLTVAISLSLEPYLNEVGDLEYPISLMGIITSAYRRTHNDGDGFARSLSLRKSNIENQPEL